MTGLPTLTYIETASQVVPDINDVRSFETTLPVVSWNGKHLQIKETWDLYQKLDNNSNSTIAKLRLRHSLIKIIASIQQSHPEYLKYCLNSDNPA